MEKRRFFKENFLYSINAMVNRAFLEKGYGSRPKTSVVVQGFVSLIFLALAMGFFFAWLYKPELFAFMEGIVLHVPNADSTLVDFINYYSLHLAATCILLIVPASMARKMVMKRAIFLIFAIPIWALQWVLPVFWALFLVPPVAAQFNPELVSQMQNTWIGLALYADFAFIGAASIFEILYCVIPPFKYRKIYSMRRRSIRYCSKHFGEPFVPKPSEVRNNFFKLYRKKKYDEMLDLLYPYVFEKVKTSPLTKDELTYFAYFVGKVDHSIREKEFGYLNGQANFPVQREILDMLAQQNKLSNAGEVAAKEDLTLLAMKKAPAAPIIVQAPAPLKKPASNLTMDRTKTDVSPIPAPDKIGEAWKKKA